MGLFLNKCKNCYELNHPFCQPKKRGLEFIKYCIIVKPLLISTWNNALTFEKEKKSLIPIIKQPLQRKKK